MTSAQASPADKRYIVVSTISEKNATASVQGSKDGEKVAIVIPTLNERENLILLVPQIEDIFEEHGINGHLIVVDDHSKDGTGEAAKTLAKTYRNITVIERAGKLGIGSAYRCGFKRALAMNMDIIFEMDADLSHRPEYIPEFLNALKTSHAGLIIGSRYIEQGASKNWPVNRKMISFGANLSTKMALGVSKTHDMTSGFRAYRAQVLRDIDYEKLITNGYAWQIETMYRTTLAGYEIKEIPIVFYEREIGKSKLGTKDLKEFVIFLIRSFVKRVQDLLNQRFIKFCIVGLVGAILVLGIGVVTRFFTTDGTIYVITNTIATVLAMLLNFTFNKIWTFQDRQKAVMKQLPTDLFGRTMTFLLNLLIVALYANQHWLLATIAGIVVQILINFAWNKFLVFKNRTATSEMINDS
jgi:dolichol-phosphate mannosyltransferase